MVSINTVIQGKKQQQTLNSIFSLCISFHIYSQCFTTHIFRHECVCICTLTYTLPLLRNHIIIHSEALILRNVKLKVLLPDTISNKPFHFLTYFINLHFIYYIRLSQNTQSYSRLRRLGRTYLFFSSTQPLIR